MTEKIINTAAAVNIPNGVRGQTHLPHEDIFGRQPRRGRHVPEGYGQDSEPKREYGHEYAMPKLFSHKQVWGR